MTAQVGLVLDLTNTGRYYHPDEWESQGIRHIKVGSTDDRLLQA